MEDLYIYKKSNWKNGNYRLYDCICKVVENPTNDILHFHEITAKSLNNLYAEVFVTFFAHQGSTATNAFNSFYTDPNNLASTLDRFRDDSN